MRTPARMAVSSAVSPGIAPAPPVATVTGTASTLFTAAVKYDVILDTYTVVPTKSDSDVMCCLQSYQWPRIDISLVY